MNFESVIMEADGTDLCPERLKSQFKKLMDWHAHYYRKREQTSQKHWYKTRHYCEATK